MYCSLLNVLSTLCVLADTLIKAFELTFNMQRWKCYYDIKIHQLAENRIILPEIYIFLCVSKNKWVLASGGAIVSSPVFQRLHFIVPHINNLCQHSIFLESSTWTACDLDLFTPDDKYILLTSEMVKTAISVALFWHWEPHGGQDRNGELNQQQAQLNRFCVLSAHKIFALPEENKWKTCRSMSLSVQPFIYI